MPTLEAQAGPRVYELPAYTANTLVYLLAHDSREAAAASWAAFGADPEWIAARDASQVGGTLVAGIESVYMTATDYSPMH